MRQPWAGKADVIDADVIDSVQAGGIGDGQTKGVLHHGAGREEAGLWQRGGGDDHAGAEDGRGAGLVGFLGQRAGNAEGGGSQAGGVAGMQAETVEDDLFGEQAVDAVLAGQGLRQARFGMVRAWWRSPTVPTRG